MRSQLDDYQTSHLGNFELIYPCEKNTTYDRIYKIAIKQFNQLSQHPRDKLKLEMKAKKRRIHKNPKTPKQMTGKKKKS